VLQAEKLCIIEKPVASLRSNDSQSRRELPNAIKPPPKVTAQTAITRPNPTMLLRIASVIALTKAPTSVAPVKNPKV
jgi:hypothetical protein